MHLFTVDADLDEMEKAATLGRASSRTSQDGSLETIKH